MIEDRYKPLREALDRDEELATVALGQRGAARLAQEEADRLIAEAKAALTDGYNKAQEAYEKVEMKARATRDGIINKLQEEYNAVESSQAVVVATANLAADAAEEELRVLRAEIERDWGVHVPGSTPVTTSIRVG